MVEFDDVHCRIRWCPLSNLMILIFNGFKRISSNGRLLDVDVELIAGLVLQSNLMTTWSNSIVLRWNWEVLDVLELFFKIIEFDWQIVEFDYHPCRIQLLLVEFDHSFQLRIFSSAFWSNSIRTYCLLLSNSILLVEFDWLDCPIFDSA